jgi:hypothetical protein
MARLDTIALSSGPVGVTQAAFGGLLHAVGLSAVLYPRGEGRRARKRLQSLAAQNETASTVIDVLRTQAAEVTALSAAMIDTGSQ